jgi:hypothetical protein
MVSKNKHRYQQKNFIMDTNKKGGVEFLFASIFTIVGYITVSKIKVFLLQTACLLTCFSQYSSI